MTVYKSILFPSFQDIIERAKGKMVKKFEEYENSWVNCFDWLFWKNRLSHEILEIWSAKTREEKQEEILDAINILCMMYENTGWDEEK